MLEVRGPVTSDDSGSAFAKLGQRGLVGRMHEQLDELLAARDQMEQLLQLIVEIGSDLNLDATLSRIVRAAKELTSAPYGALAIRDPDGALISFSPRRNRRRCGAANRAAAGWQGRSQFVAPRRAGLAFG